ncbi:MAG: protein translocase subunit SecF [Proteobacteria bacterium]|nr:protein translocase subunit SecF [Pseudomonadota bacterium]
MRFPIRPFEHVPHLDFMRWRTFWLWSSFIGGLLACALLGYQGLNYGIDFVGGKLIEVQTAEPAQVGMIRQAVDSAGFEGATIQEFGSNRDFIIRLPGNNAEVQKASAEAGVVAALQGKVSAVELRRVEFVGPQVGQELRLKGLQAMGISILAILIYVWLRFEMRYGLGAILALVHDVVLTIGIMSLLHTEVTLTVLAAILTLIGYSLNDTIVIFDRVRENRGRYPNRPLPEVLNLSVNQTLGRTIMTVSTVLLVLVALFFWGGEVIHDFAMVLIVGTALGTYSSVFVASAVLLALEEWYQRMGKEDAKRQA